MKMYRSIVTTVSLALFYLMSTITSAQAANRDEVIFFFNDHLGSAVAAVSESGELCWSEEYTAYGDKGINDDVFNTTGCGIVGEERGFTGHTEDVNSDLVYMQQRYYDPSIGRFLSIDPVESNPNSPMTFNRYAYANNNPYKYTDPDGELAMLAYFATPPGIAMLTTAYIGFTIGVGIYEDFGNVMQNSASDKSATTDEDVKSDDKPRFVGQPDGELVDTEATPQGSYDQPDGGRTDILQGEDHGSGLSHTHRPKINVVPDTGEVFINGLDHGSAVSAEDVNNITTGDAVKRPPLKR